MEDPNLNLGLSLDDIIKQRKAEEKKEQGSKKRTPVKAKETKKGKPTSSQKATGASKAKRDAKMAAKRGISKSTKPTKGQVEKEINRQQRSGKGGGPGSRALSVFVGNLSYSTSWQNLADHMRRAGNVDRATILSGNDGRSKGCGVVVYQHPKDAERAIRTLTGSKLDGREIFVQEDKNSNLPQENNGSNKCSVYVGSLSFDTSWQDLKDYFRRCGNVDNAKIFQMPNGRSKGSGLVTYQHPKDAQRAIRDLNQTMFQGRSIIVRADGGSAPPSNNAGPPPQKSNRRDAPDNTQLYVGNLNWETSWQNLKDYFRSAGDIERADIASKDGRSKGFGIVKFHHPRDAQRAIQMFNGTELGGRKLEVRLDSKV